MNPGREVVINVCVEASEDWLFGDLKKGFARTAIAGTRIEATDEPIEADSWIFIRTAEAASSPDLNRTVVCIHDLYGPDGSYLPGGARSAVRDAAALALCHPSQRAILEAEHVDLASKRIIERPLGALSGFTTRNTLSPRFRVGWIGRFHHRKRCEWFPEVVRLLRGGTRNTEAVLIGKDLDTVAQTLAEIPVACEHYNRRHCAIEDYPAIYKTLDCVVITSSTEAGPLPLFEALATGIPVVSTPVGWAPYFHEFAPHFVRLGSSPAELADHIAEIREARSDFFERRTEIAALAEPFRLEGWYRELVYLAKSLVFPLRLD